jgi:hypothetical protein
MSIGQRDNGSVLWRQAQASCKAGGLLVRDGVSTRVSGAITGLGGNHPGRARTAALKRSGGVRGRWLATRGGAGRTRARTVAPGGSPHARRGSPSPGLGETTPVEPGQQRSSARAAFVADGLLRARARGRTRARGVTPGGSPGPFSEGLALTQTTCYPRAPAGVPV